MRIRFLALFFCILLLVISEAMVEAAGNKIVNTRLSIFQPLKNSETSQDFVKLEGSASPGGGLVTINGKKLRVPDNGFFEAMLLLHPGKNLAKVSLYKKGKLVKRGEVKIIKNVVLPDLEKPFVKQKHWAKKATQSLATLGIVEPYPDGRFYPSMFATKGEFATWLSKTYSLRPETPNIDPFIDVPKDHWRAPFVQAVVEKGWMKGNSNYFGIDDSLTRLEAVKIVLMSEDISETSGPEDKYFSDVPVQNEENRYLYPAFLAGLIKGMEKSACPSFEPDRAITRAETATLLSRTKAIREKESVTNDWGKGFDESSLCGVSLPPVILSVSCSPEIAFNDGNSVIKAIVVVSGEGISQVKADLTQLGGPNDALMNEEVNGDSSAKKGRVFSLEVPVDVSIPLGEKEIVFIVSNNMGMQDSDNCLLQVDAQNSSPKAIE